VNQLGLGFIFSAKDKASAAFRAMSGALVSLRGEAKKTQQEIAKVQPMGGGAAGATRLRGGDGRFVAGAGGAGAGAGKGAGGAGGASMSGGAGAVFAGAGLAGALGLAALVPAREAAEQYGKSLANIRTIVDETAFSTADLQKVTMGLAGTYGIDAFQQAEGLYETISAGITDAKQATELLTVANKFAVGGTTDLKSSVDVLTSAVNTYRDQGLTAAQASDMMFVAIAAGKTTARELSASLGEVAPTAHAAGVSFAELQASIAAMTQQGIRTPQAVTGLNAMLSNLMKPSKDAADEAQRLGVEFSATALKTKGLQGVLNQLAGNTKVNDETFVKLFGSVDGVKAALALASEDGRVFGEILNQMKAAAGSTDKAFKTMSESDAFATQQLDALKKSALILIGQALRPLVAGVVQFGSAVLGAFAKLPAPMRAFLVQGFAIGAMLLVVTAALVAFGVAAAAVGAPFIIGAALAAAALGGIIAAVVGLKYAIDNNIGGLGDKFAAVAAKAKLGWEGLKQAFTDGGFSGAVRDELNKAENAGLKAFIVNVFTLGSRIAEFASQVKAGFASVVETMGPTFDRLGAAFGKIMSMLGLTSNSTEKAKASWNSFSAAGAKVGSALGTAFDLVVRAISAVMEVGAGFIGTWGNIKAAMEPARSALSGMGAVLSDVGKKIGLISPGAATSGWEKFGKVIGTTVEFVVGFVSGVVRVLTGVVNFIAGIVEIIAGIFTGDWGMIWNGAKKVVFGLLQAVGEILLAMASQIAQVIDGLGALVDQDIGATAKVDELRKSMRGGIDAMLEETADVKSEAPSSTATAAAAQLDILKSSMPATGIETPGWVAGLTSAIKEGGKAVLPQQVINFQIDGETVASLVMGKDGRETSPLVSPT